MRRDCFIGRCKVCGERAKVWWIERGRQREVVNCCAGCVERIKNLLYRYRQPVEQVDQGVLAGFIG